MKKDNKYIIAISELNSILSNMSSDDINKIPLKLLKFFEKNNDERYNIKINPKKSLKEQNLNSETINLLAVLYRNYWCDNKSEYDKKLLINQKKYDEELTKKYEVKFDKIQIPKENISENLPIDISKDHLYEKIFKNIYNFIYKIKSQFKRK